MNWAVHKNKPLNSFAGSGLRGGPLWQDRCTTDPFLMWFSQASEEVVQLLTRCWHIVTVLEVVGVKEGGGREGHGNSVEDGCVYLDACSFPSSDDHQDRASLLINDWCLGSTVKAQGQSSTQRTLINMPRLTWSDLMFFFGPWKVRARSSGRLHLSLVSCKGKQSFFFPLRWADQNAHNQELWHFGDASIVHSRWPKTKLSCHLRTECLKRNSPIFFNSMQTHQLHEPTLCGDQRIGWPLYLSICFHL